MNTQVAPIASTCRNCDSSILMQCVMVHEVMFFVVVFFKLVARYRQRWHVCVPQDGLPNYKIYSLSSLFDVCNFELRSSHPRHRQRRMRCCHFYLVIGTLVIPQVSSLHSDLRRELTAIRNLISSIEGKLGNVNQLEKKIQDMEQNLNSLMSGVEELNRKSSLLREIHQDNDGRNELLQRIARSIDDMNRKQTGLVGRKHKGEVEKLDKLSENVQALFQIFGGLSRKLEDFQGRVVEMSSSFSLSDFKLHITKKLDSLTTSTTLLRECLQCRKGQTLKEVFQSSLRHTIDRKLQICTVSDFKRSLSQYLEPKLSGLLESLRNDINYKFRKFGSELEDTKQGCKISSESLILKPANNLAVAAGDMAYSHDTLRDRRKSKSGEGDSSTPRETPGRIFRKLWRKMTEPINKVGDKIESLGHKLEISHQKHYNHTVNKLMELAPKSDVPTDSCSKQVRVLADTAKDTLSKVGLIETRQLTVQSMCSKILTELERVKSLTDTEDDGTTISQSFKPGGAEFFNGSAREGYQIPTSCAELQEQGIVKSSIYTIKPKNSTEEFLAYCDMETDGGGWTVIQRRGDYGELRQNFTQGWEMYKRGFGDFQREFWLGNEKLHLLSVQEDVKLRVELEDFEDETAYAEYSRFRVEDESHQYRLSVGGYKGNATDSLSLHDGKYFSTEDRDNDEVSSCCNCADTFKGGWWYYRCFEANLNGPYHTVPTDNGYFLGIIWERWKGDYSLKSSEMKIRPLSFDELQDP